MDTLTPDKQLLSYLAEAGIGQYRDISGFLNKHFPPPDTTTTQTREHLKNVKQFAYTLAEHKFIRVEFHPRSGDEYFIYGLFTSPIKAMILKDGMAYLSKSKEKPAAAHIQLNAKNINYTGNIGHSNRYSAQRSADDKPKSDLPSKIKKWVAVIVALGVAVPTIMLAWNKLKYSPNQEKVPGPNVDSFKKADSIKRLKPETTVAHSRLKKPHPTASDAFAPMKIENNTYYYSIPLSNENINRLLTILPAKSTPINVCYSDQDSLIAQKILNWIIKQNFEVELHKNEHPICGQMPLNSFAYRYISIQTESFLTIYINCL